MTFSVVSPVLPRPALDISPPPHPKSVPQRGEPRWARSLLRPKNPRLWGLGIGSVALGLVNGALVISAGVGLVAYQQLLQLSPRQRKGLIQRLQQGLPLPATPQQQALVLGLVAGTSTYTFTALWHSTHSLLMALLLTGQGALALFAVGALVRSSRSADRSDDLWNAAPVAQVDHNLTLLSHPDPLKRLVAVRRLVRLAQGNEAYLVGVSVRSHLLDCFQLCLGQEREEIVRSALEEGLTLLGQVKPLPSGSVKPFSAPFTTDSALDIAEQSNPNMDTQSISIANPSVPPNTLILEEIEPVVVLQDSPQTDRVASIMTPIHTLPPTAKGRRSTVEYVEYSDI